MPAPRPESRRHACKAAWVLALLAPACAPMSGVASLTVLSRDPALGRTLYKPIGPRVTDSDCTHWIAVIVVAGNAAPNHETVISRMLAEYDADVLLDAELANTSVGFPYIYMRNCARVSGVPARLVGGGR